MTVSYFSVDYHISEVYLGKVVLQKDALQD